MKAPFPIPYQGSKRGLADLIIGYLPDGASRLVEPFAGAAAVTLEAAGRKAVDAFWLNDINEPLMRLWDAIVNCPERIAEQYRRLWQEQLGRERQYYDDVRERFNRTKDAADLLYLLSRCVKASIRYNEQGEFNQSPDNRRRGMRPSVKREHILAASRLLQGRVTMTAVDYREVLRQLRSSDIVYMDPPYQGVVKNRDPRYAHRVVFDEFVEALDRLNARQIPYIVSYDGRTGEKPHGEMLPDSLGLVHIELDAGISTQATLLGHRKRTTESLYLSQVIATRLRPPRRVRQLRLKGYCDEKQALA